MSWGFDMEINNTRQVDFFFCPSFSGFFPLWKNKFKTIILLVNFSFKRMVLNWTKTKEFKFEKEIKVISIRLNYFLTLFAL